MLIRFCAINVGISASLQPVGARESSRLRLTATLGEGPVSVATWSSMAVESKTNVPWKLVKDDVDGWW